MLGDPDPAPLGPGQLGGDAPRAKARVTEGEGEDAVLEVRADLVGHPRPAPLADPQPVEAVALELRLPGVVGGSGHPHRPAGLRDVAELLGQGEQAQPESEQHVILSHRVLLVFLIGTWKRGRTRGRPGHGRGVRMKASLWSPEVSGQLGVSPV